MLSSARSLFLSSFFCFLLFLFPLASQGCYHPQYYKYNTVTTHLDDINSDMTQNPLITYADPTVPYSYSVNLDSIWEATSPDGGITLNPVANSKMTAFGEWWCIEPKTSDATEFATGAVYQASPGSNGRFTTFWMSTTAMGTNSLTPSPEDPDDESSKNIKEVVFNDPSLNHDSHFHLGASNMPTTAIVRFNITFTNYVWVSQDPNAMLVVAFKLADNLQPNTNLNFDSVGPGTIDFAQGYFSMNKTMAASGPALADQVRVQMTTDPQNPNLVYVTFQHFDTDVNLDPELGQGEGPGPMWSASPSMMSSMTMSGDHKPHTPGDLSPWAVVLIVASVGLVSVVVIACVGTIIVRSRRAHREHELI